MDKKDKRLLQWHVGKGGQKAHPDVDEFQSGFMTPSMLNEHNAALVKRTNVGDSSGTDILTLSIGNYAGSYWINHPSSAKTTDINAAYAYVSVIPSSTDSRRFIVLVEAATGRIWTRTVNDTYDVNNKWTKIEQFETLWEGNSKMTTPVTLASSILDQSGNPTYSSIFVDYTTDTNNHGRQYGTRYDVTINTSNENNTLNVMAPVLYEAQIVFPTSTTAKMEVNKATVINTRSDGAAFLADATAAGTINILRICGLR